MLALGLALVAASAVRTFAGLALAILAPAILPFTGLALARLALTVLAIIATTHTHRTLLGILAWLGVATICTLRLLTILAITIATIFTLRLPAVIAGFALAAILAVAFRVAIATELGFGLRAVGRILLLPAFLLVAAVILPPLLAIRVATRSLSFDLFIGGKLVPAFAGAFFTALAAAEILSGIALGAITPIRVVRILLLLLLLSRRDNAVIMLGMLEIALGDNPIA